MVQPANLPENVDFFYEVFPYFVDKKDVRFVKFKISTIYICMIYSVSLA